MQHTVFAFSRRNLRLSRGNGSRRQRGVTLVEWMVSITIGLVLVAGLTLLFAQQSSTQGELEKSSRQIESGRYAMQLLRDDVQLAGFYGEFTLPVSAPAAANPCTKQASDLVTSRAFAIQGYDAPGTSLPSDFSGCPLDAANHRAGTDILVVRRADAATVSGGLTVGQVYLQSGLTVSQTNSTVIAIAAATTVDNTVFNLKDKNGSFTPLRKYLVHIYFVSPCSVAASGSSCSSSNTDDGGVSIPTLKRMELSAAGGSPVFTTVPLVEGVENMQVDYGVDASGDGAPDSFVTTVSALADWANVMALRINLLARNNERTTGYVDNKSYALGLAGATTATGDSFKRHVFSQLVRVVNPGSWRDQ